MGVTKEFSSEDELLQYIDDYYKEKELKVEVYKILNDDEDNETIGCTQGCPQNYIIEDSDLVVVCFSKDELLKEYYKDELHSAFTQANNYRLKRAIQRKNLQRFNKDLPSFPFVNEKPLTKDEILKYVSPDLERTKLFENLLDSMVKRLEIYSNSDEYNVGFFESVKENFEDTTDLIVGLFEGTIKGSANLMVEGFQGTASLSVGIVAAIENMSIDKGITTMRESFSDMREDFSGWEMNASSQEALDKNEYLNYVKSTLKNMTQNSVASASEMWGEEAGELVNDGILALSKVVGLGVMRVPLNKTMKASVNGTKQAHYLSKKILDRISKGDGKTLSHMSLYKREVLSSGTLGTPGDIFAGPISNANLSGIPLMVRTGLNPTLKFENINVFSDAFRKVVPMGPFTFWQRAMGHQYTPRGFLHLDTGKFVRTGVNKTQLKNYATDVVLDASIAGLVYYKTRDE